MIGLMLFLFFTLSPFYIFESGNIQPSHAILLLLAAYYFVVVLKMKIGDSLIKYGKPLFYFSLYVFFVNAILAMSSDTWIPLKYSLFYIFNLFSFILLFSICSTNYRYLKIVFYSVVFSSYLQIALALSDYGRYWLDHQPMLFFNNPHQLGYYSLLSSSLILLLGSFLKIKPLNLLVFNAPTVYLSIISVSLSATIAIALTNIIYILSLYSYNYKKSLFTLVFISVVIGILFSDIIHDKSINADFFNRISSKFDTKFSREGGWYSGRGYETLIENRDYLFFGMGELPGRFYNEFHSSIGNILRSYGVIGLSLIFLFGYKIFRRAPKLHLYLFIPIIIYGLAHNGIRQPYLWIYLGLVTAIFTLKANYPNGKKHN